MNCHDTNSAESAMSRRKFDRQGIICRSRSRSADDGTSRRIRADVRQ
jgi:hypothetical protein